MEVKSKIYGTTTYKSTTISHWKKWGVICEDFDMLYQEYIKTTKCNHCGKDFKSTRDRCLDHDHTTGLFRAFLCHNCNSHDSYIKYPNGYDNKEYKKQYYQDNKEIRNKYLEKRKQIKIICECGSVFRINELLRHTRTFKHNNPFCDYPKTNIFM